MLLFGGRERFLDCPISLKSIKQGHWMNLKAFSPILDTQCLAVQGKHVVGSFVPILFCPSSPTSIKTPSVFKTVRALTARVIPGIIRITINRMFGGRFIPQISKEVREVLPSCTYSHILINHLCGTCIQSALNHGRPRNIFRRICLTVGGHLFTLKASTRTSRSIVKMILGNHDTLAAVTYTFPIASINSTNWSKASEFFVKTIRYASLEWHRLISFKHWLVGDTPLDGLNVAAASLYHS